MARAVPGAKKSNHYGAYVVLADALVECRREGGLKDQNEEKTFYRDLRLKLQSAKVDLIADLPRWFLDRITRQCHFDSVDERDRVRRAFWFLKTPLEKRSADLGRLGHYRVLRLLGAGGMGVVFEAVAEGDQLRGNSVAIKTIRPDRYNDETRQRFESEAAFMHVLCNNNSNTTNIVRINSYHPATSVTATGKSMPYFVMDYVCGPSLRDLYDAFPDGVFPLELAIDIALQIARGLRTAHTVTPAIAHRDLKPGNVLLRRVPNVRSATGWDVLVGDFGLARSAVRSTSTPATDFSGNELYCAPEQCTPNRPVDYRCDLFALGLILHEMLLGWHPRSKAKAGTLKYDPFIDWSPKLALASVPPDLAKLVTGLLAKESDERWTIDQAIAGLKKQLAEALAKRRTSSGKSGRGTSSGDGPKYGRRRDRRPGRNEVVADMARAFADLDPPAAEQVTAVVRRLVMELAPDIDSARAFDKGLAAVIVKYVPSRDLIPEFTDLLLTDRFRNDAKTKRLLREVVNRYAPWDNIRSIPELSDEDAPVLDRASSAAVAELLAARSANKPSWFRNARDSWTLAGVLAVEWEGKELPSFGPGTTDSPESPTLLAAIAVMEDILATTEVSLFEREPIRRATSAIVAGSGRAALGSTDIEQRFREAAMRVATSLERTQKRRSIQRPSYCVVRFDDPNKREFACQALARIREAAPALRIVEVVPTAKRDELILTGLMHDFLKASETEPRNA